MNETTPTSLTVQEPREQSNVQLRVISRIALLASPSSCRERSVCDVQPVLVAYDPHGNVIEKLGSNDQPWQVVASVLNGPNVQLIGAIGNYTEGQSRFRSFGVTTVGSYQFEFRFIPPSNVSRYEGEISLMDLPFHFSVVVRSFSTPASSPSPRSSPYLRLHSRRSSGKPSKRSMSTSLSVFPSFSSIESLRLAFPTSNGIILIGHSPLHSSSSLNFRRTVL